MHVPQELSLLPGQARAWAVWLQQRQSSCRHATCCTWQCKRTRQVQRCSRVIVLSVMQFDVLAAATLGAMERSVALGRMVDRIFHAPRRRAAGGLGSARATRRSMIAPMVGSVSSARWCSALGVVLGAGEKSAALAWMALQPFHAHRHPRIGARASAKRARTRSLIARRANSAG